MNPLLGTLYLLTVTVTAAVQLRPQWLSAGYEGEEAQCLLQTSSVLKVRPPKIPSQIENFADSDPQTPNETLDTLLLLAAQNKPSTLTGKQHPTSLIDRGETSLAEFGSLPFHSGRISSLLDRRSAGDGSTMGLIICVVLFITVLVGGSLTLYLLSEKQQDEDPLSGLGGPKKYRQASEGWEPGAPRSLPHAKTATRDSAPPGGSRTGLTASPASGGPQSYQRAPRALSHDPDKEAERGGRSALSSALASAVSDAEGKGSGKAGPTRPAQVPELALARTHVMSEDPLCDNLVVPHGEAVYLLPDLTNMRRPVEAFDILSQNGSPVLGVVVNDGAEDPGILLHAPRSTDGAGMPLAFIGTSPNNQRIGSLPIARPCSSRPNGESFGNLLRDASGSYSVVRNSRLQVRIEGDFVGRCMTLRDGSALIGSTRPCGEAYGQMRLELHIGAGSDAALTILCLLAIVRAEATGASRLSTGSTTLESLGSRSHLSSVGEQPPPTGS